MSATRNAGRTGTYDYYKTPEAVTLALLREVMPRPEDARVLEPCAGNGRIARALLAHGVGSALLFELRADMRVPLRRAATGLFRVLRPWRKR